MSETQDSGLSSQDSERAPAESRGEAALGDWRASAWKRLQVRLIAALGAPLLRAIGASLRWEVVGREHLEAIERAGRRPIFAFWHGRILAATYFWRNRGIVVITSENFDGEWIAQIIERFGYGTARGSTSRGAARALIQLRRELERDRPAAFTVDGPRGPIYRVQPGAVWLAKASGQPILPFHIEAQHKIMLGSWDRTQIPLPFSRVVVVQGAPFEVPASADEELLEVKRAELEGILLKLRDRAESWWGKL